jgi:hypothetical protein
MLTFVEKKTKAGLHSQAGHFFTARPGCSDVKKERLKKSALFFLD